MRDKPPSGAACGDETQSR